MKKFLICLALFLSAAVSVFAADIPKGWETDIAKASKRATAEKKPILLLISGPEWCGPCRSLDSNVIKKKNFNRIAQKYAVCLFIHHPGKKSPELTAKLNQFKGIFKGGVPCYAVLDKDLKQVSVPKQRTIAGFISAISEAVVKNGGKPIPELKKLNRLESKKDKDSKKDRKSKKNRKNKKSKKSSSR